jgi:hypothetical protein
MTMASMVLSAERVLPIRNVEVRPAAQVGSRWTASCSWQAIGNTASGLAFVGALGWESWRIGSCLLHFLPAIF